MSERLAVELAAACMVVCLLPVSHVVVQLHAWFLF